ncbi:MAG: reverse transcriptase domain-containing protein [Actinomycetota bacterium]|nr:reverse transcriptase domain-containing protein [Actinomycetota bacterium]
MRSLLMLLGSLPQAQMATTLKPTFGSARLLIDSQTIDRTGGTQYHLIKSENHFTSIDKNAAPVPVAPAKNGVAPMLSIGVGTCTYVTMMGELLSLYPCLLVPDIAHNLINVKRVQQTGVTPDFHRGVFRWSNGQEVAFDTNDYSLSVIPVNDLIENDHHEGVLAAANVITRGKNGPMHVDNAMLTAKQSEELAAWCNRLGSPPAAVLNNLHKLVEGAPDVLRKANVANVANDARMLATARKIPAPSLKYPLATKAGERTARDWWDAKTTSRIDGSKGYFTYIDIATSYFTVYPRTSKAGVDKIDRRYIAEAKRDGVDIDIGGVMFSDNEQIFMANAVQDQIDDNMLVRENSNPYEPWSDGQAEVVHRYHPDCMRRAAITGGLPGGDFFPWLALWAMDVLNAIRERGGTSVYEHWHNKKFDISTLRPPGCFAAVDMPLSWRGHKIDQQRIEAIYLCRSRNRPGSTFWSPKYGLLYSSQFTCNESRFPFKHDGWSLDDCEYDDDYRPAGGATNLDVADSDDDTEPDEEVLVGDDRINDDMANAPTPRSEATTDERDEPSPVGTHTATESDESASDEVAPLRRSNRLLMEQDGGTMPQHFLGRYDKMLDEADPDAQHSGMVSFAAHLAEAASLHYDLICDELDKKRMETNAMNIPGPFAKRSALPPEFAEADQLEINGILYDHEAAIEVPMHKVPVGKKIERILSIRSVKKDGRHKTRCAANNPEVPKHTRTQSPTLMSASMRAICAMSANMEMSLAFRDFHLAYLNANLSPEEYFYCFPPTSARQYDEHGQRLVWMVVKALYGAPFSGRKWYDTIRHWLIDYGFVPSDADPCVFVYKKKKYGKPHLIIGLYVDDMIIAYRDNVDLVALDVALLKDFMVKEVEPNFLSVEVDDNQYYTTLTMTKYIERMITDIELVPGPHHTPCDPSLADMVKTAKAKKHDVDTNTAKEYRRIVGKILYVCVMVRPDLAWSVGQLSQALTCPTSELLAQARQVVSYLYNTRDLGLRYKKGDKSKMYGMSDANWATSRSTSGWVFFLAGAFISGKSAKQLSIAMSSTEAEIMAASLAALEAVFLLALYELCMGVKHGSVKLFVDNSGAVDMSKDYVANNRTRHIERRHLKIRELVQRSIIDTKWIKTDDNVADIFTKYLGRDKFKKFRSELLNM